jgi:GNAT superfamily N-acetyltransferase
MTGPYTIRELPEAEFTPLFERHLAAAFENVHSYDPHTLMNDAERARIAELRQAMGAPYRLHLGVFDRNDDFVGWSWGVQENATTYHMVNAAILQAHRRQGLYTALLTQAIARLTAQGFQLIYSRHCATNNAIIIPKLQAGFLISKMEIDDRFGVLIHLHFYTNPQRRRIMDYRAGQLRPDTAIAATFGMSLPARDG